MCKKNNYTQLSELSEYLISRMRETHSFCKHLILQILHFFCEHYIL